MQSRKKKHRLVKYSVFKDNFTIKRKSFIWYNELGYKSQQTV